MQLLAGQVAGDAEDHQSAGLRDPRKPPVLWVPQRVTRCAILPASHGRSYGQGSRSGVEQLGDARGAVGQVQVQQRAAAAGQRLPVAGGLGRLQLAEGVRLAGHRQVRR